MAHGFAELTLAEADILRRAMSGKFRSRIEFQKLVDKWFANCERLAYSEELAKEVWRQIESFSGYSFSKAHSASFAVESYQSLYLKTYFPLEFMVAVINNFGGFYSTEFYIHEARRYGAIIEAPEINESEYLTRIEGNIIWLGWIHIKALESRTIEQLLLERSQNAFVSFYHFFQRVPVGLEQLIILIRVGAFRNLGIPKKELLWEAHLLCNNPNKPKPQTIALFGSPEPMQFQFPVLKHYSIEDAYDQIELLGFPICSPFLLIKENYLQSICSETLLENVGKRITIYGYLVTYKRITTKTKKPQVFGYFADYKGEYFDTTHFSNSLLKYPFKGKGVYCMYGKVVEQFGFPSIEVYSMSKVEVKADPRSLEISPVVVNEISE